MAFLTPTRLRSLSLLKSLYFRYRFGRKLRLSVFRKATVKIKRSASVQGGGRLSIGVKWPAYEFHSTLFALWDRASLVVDGDFKFVTGCRVVVDEDARLELGSGYMNYNGSIACFKHIRIGRGVFIADNVSIRDSDNHKMLGRQHVVAQPVIIGDHVWIGMNATILKGVCIGEGAVIAAGAVVTRDVPAASLVGGVPARVIRKDIQWK
jgi:serine acetyltransferase